MKENAAAAELQLARETIEQLNDAFPPDAAAGERYAQGAMALVNM